MLTDAEQDLKNHGFDERERNSSHKNNYENMLKLFRRYDDNGGGKKIF